MKAWTFAKPGGVLVAMAAAACADSQMVEDLMVVPGYYDTLECPELVNQFQAASQRVRELTMLRTKASDAAGGALANALAYNAEYARAQAAMRHSQDAANRKGCDLIKKTAASTKPAPGRLDWTKPGH